jgi:outer membrane protein insertion porin family
MALFLGTAVWLRAAQISDVVVRCTVPDLDPESLRQLVVGSIQSVPGSAFNQATLSEDVKRLYRLGTFQDVRYEVEEQAGGKVLLIFLVKPTPSVHKIVFEGNASYKTKRLRSLVEHKEDVPLDEAQVAKDRAAVLDRYEERGYHGTAVTAEFRPVGDTNTVDIVFKIEEAPRAKLQGVQFVGNAAVEAGVLQKTVRTHRQWWRYIFRYRNYYNEPQLALDKDLLRELYLTKGYLDFAVDKVETQYTADRRWVTLVFRLVEGRPYTVSAVAVEVDGDRFSQRELLPLVTMKSGATYSSTTEQEDLKSLRGKYEPLGFLDLRCLASLDRNVGEQKVAVTYRIREGGPSRIRDITIVGNEVTKDSVVRRELAIHPGDLGDASKIRVSKGRLSQLNYFETVEISPVATQREDLKDLRIQLSEKRTGSLVLGAGFSTEDSVVGYLELTENNFDLNRLFHDWPPKGGGQRLRLRASLGTQTSDFRVDFTEPWFLQRRLSLNTEIFRSSREYDDYDQSDMGLGVKLTQPLRPQWRMSYGVLFDRVQLDNFDTPPRIPGSDPARYDRTLIDEEGSYWGNRFLGGVVRDTRDDFTFPRKGSRFSIEPELVTSLLGSYSDVLRLNTQAKKYISVSRNSVLRLNAEVGVAQKLAGDEVAIFDRYFAGGAGSLRGFDFREVGPVDVADNPVGGESRFVGNVEWAYEVAGVLFIYPFLDVGNVWADSFDFNPGDLNASVGLGMQLKALPVRLEYGFPVLTQWDHLDGNGGRFHFNIGWSF